MERFRQLVMELNRQLESGVGPDSLRQTIALLSMELEKETGHLPRSLGTAKVAVVLPAAPIHLTSSESAPASAAPTAAPTSSVAKPNVKPKAKSSPLVLFDEAFEVEPVSEKPAPEPNPVPAINPAFDLMEEVPTLYMHRGADLNDQLHTDSASLNDQLKGSSAERQDLLSEGPIKDLRKAIGINERFQFIRALFRDDEAMYERSIKTINQFQILPEAEFWISRELKTKLGWPVDHPLVSQFDQLVRRRFS